MKGIFLVFGLLAIANAQQFILCSNVQPLALQCVTPLNPEQIISYLGNNVSCQNVALMVSECTTSCPFNPNLPVRFQPASANIFVPLSTLITTQPNFAYGLRTLISGYSGPLIQVERSNDSATFNVSASATGFLNTAALLNFVGGGTGFVSTWFDQKNGFKLSQATQAQMPIIVSSGTLQTQNGFPCLKFTSSVSTVLSTATITLAEQLVYLSVVASTTSNDDTAALVSVTAGSGFVSNLPFIEIESSGTQAFGGFTSTAGPATISTGTLYVFQGYDSGSDAIIAINGAETTTSVPPDEEFDLASTFLFVGGSATGTGNNNFDGFICEILFSQVPDTTDIATELSNEMIAFDI
jgi:Alpha-L-arabinofuranosidase B, catalytic